jgi:hypothetical protein
MLIYGNQVTSSERTFSGNGPEAGMFAEQKKSLCLEWNKVQSWRANERGN